MSNPFENIDARLSNIEVLLLDLINGRLSHNPHAPNEKEQVLTVAEAADLLSLAAPTIYALVQRRELPFMKRNKRLYFSKQELLDWVKSGRKKTVSEIEAEAVVNMAAAGRRGK